VVIPRSLASIESHAQLLALELEASLRGPYADVVGFRSAVAVDGIVRASLADDTRRADGISLAQWRDRLAARLVAELAVKPNYSQFRTIGIADGGREIVRVDRSGPGKTIRVVPEAELEQRGDSDYFQRAIRLGANEVDVSPIELNHEHGVVELPHVPVIRTAAAIHAPGGKPFGIVVINVDLSAEFARIRAVHRANSQIFVVNELGDYLLHPDPSREFGFVFAKPQRLDDDFPDLAGAATRTSSLARIVRDRDGAGFGIALAPARLAQGPLVAVAEAVPYAQVIAPAIAVRNAILTAGLAAVLLAVILAVLLARSLTRPLVAMTRAVQAFGRGQPMSVPAGASGEIGTLSSAFARMAAEMQEKSAALTQETAERRRLFETSLDLIVVADSQGVFIQISPSALAILGYRPEEMIGKSGIGFVHPDDVDIARTEMRRARRERVTRVFECRYVHKDGHPVTLQWIGVWSEPERRHFYIGRDITERKQAEQALLESERVARGIIDTALDAFIQMDESGNVIEWNPHAETMFGWSRAEAVGRSLASMIVPPALRARHNEGIARFLQTGEGRILGTRFEIEAQTRDGEIILVEIAVTALRRGGGYVFNGFIRDLTEKIAAEAQLRQSQKMDAVGHLTGGVAHDFNNILTVITGTIEILAEGVADRPKLATIARMIDEAATRGAELTHQLLAFARRQPLEPRLIDPNALVTETASLLRPKLGEQIEIEAMLEDNVWRAVADPAQLTTALLNLAVNVRDAMPDGGKLTLETGKLILDEAYAQSNAEVRAGPYVMIAVSDTGSGIAPEVLERVFEPFFTTKEVGKGTGLGLSMVYGFVRQSGGHIKVYSEVGHGTTIKIYLPRAEAAEVAAAAPAAVSAVPGGARPSWWWRTTGWCATTSRPSWRAWGIRRLPPRMPRTRSRT
jgi:PAS domain S-box-containing protein